MARITKVLPINPRVTCEKGAILVIITSIILLCPAVTPLPAGWGFDNRQIWPRCGPSKKENHEAARLTTLPRCGTLRLGVPLDMWKPTRR